MKQLHTTTTVTIDGIDHELELEVNVNPAEHDVGIINTWIDDWEITAVDGNTDKAVILAMHEAVEKEYGDEKFIEKLYDEDAAEVDYDDYD